MITLIYDVDLRTRERLSVVDPFQLATPCWRVRQFLLPPEATPISIEEIKQHMPIKVVEEKLAPSRLSKGGTVTMSSDFNDVMLAMRDAKQGQAIIVTLADPNLLKEEKPENKFAYALRRMFASKGLPHIAYQSGKLEVTIRKPTPAEVAMRASQGKGKKK